MVITKYIHSCLLIEENNKSILIDPGQYTYEEGVLDIQAIKKPDYIIYTHEHADHFYPPFLVKLLAAFPDVTIIGTNSVINEIGQAHKKLEEKGNETVKIHAAEHEPLLLLSTPENFAVTVFNKLTHPGDSYQFAESAEILAMPMTAPWGSMVASMKIILQHKPKIVIPIHDWHWKDAALAGFYPRIADFMKEHEITFLIPETGKPLTI